MTDAKPTIYRDVAFRSRLEAKWAAFFDIAGWRWEYEPFTLRRWTPDFILRGDATEVLVEVKPIEWAQQEPAQVLQRTDLNKVLANCNARVEMENLKKEIVVLGNGPQMVVADWVLGAFVDEAWGSAPDWAVIGNVPQPSERVFDFYARNGAFAYRMGGEWDGDAHLRPVNDNLALRAWMVAGNATQWKPPTKAYAGPIGPLFREIARKSRREFDA